MKIEFNSKKLQKKCNNKAMMVKEWGPVQADKIAQRLEELSAADNLAQIAKVPPPRCHEYTSGQLRGKFSVDLKHPYRLLFFPAHDPLPKRPDGSLDWNKVTEIIIFDIRDPH